MFNSSYQRLLICLASRLALPFLDMALPTLLPCDGCGQLASPEHIARRLQHLEWATRFRPIHIQALLLTASAPEADSGFLYAPDSAFTGQAAVLLSALAIPVAGRSSAEILADVQKRGLVLASLLECSIEPGTDPNESRTLLERHLPQALARIRRSLKPKRILAIAPELQPFLAQLTESALGCPVFFTPLSTFPGGTASNSEEVSVFRAALPASTAQGV
ncbi:MAG TPA: hypothetical protein VFI38_13215 [Candidatus Acidoferrum sp.]|nr:hypothetical protein [Candidatus Acidoferrum sp.]